MNRIGKIPYLLTLPALLLIAHACSATPPPAPTPTPINVRAILDESGKVMAALQSFHFRMQHNKGGTPLLQSLILTDVNGIAATPDSLSLDFTGVAGSFAVKGSVVALGDDVYMTNPLSGEWQEIEPLVSPLAFFDPAHGIGEMMSQVQNPTLVSQDAEAYRIAGSLPAHALAPLFGGNVAAGDVDLQLTIHRARLHLTEVIITGRITPAEEAGLVRTLILSQFDEPVNIERPR